ncbi:hypothetical protein N1030_11935 [Desulfovibrio mangrovi]|uniref:RHS repeat domain-containing protein n=1 Tax=Desulfovibrio mangrovi TaxID=2976983 RepID=UPI002247483C|nr:RHS repeat-associated core domain-containing protein [Desulfovibrio mangrovi]UZP66323.1 hypothetical protein N1030_11935 [Desulfovibrio mangrovi]
MARHSHPHSGGARTRMMTTEEWLRTEAFASKPRNAAMAAAMNPDVPMSTEEYLRAMFGEQEAGWKAANTVGPRGGAGRTMAGKQGGGRGTAAAGRAVAAADVRPSEERGAFDVSGMFADEWETQFDDNGLPVFADQTGYRVAGAKGSNGQADWFRELVPQGDDVGAAEGGSAVAEGAGSVNSGSVGMPQAGPDQMRDLTPDSLPREELRRFAVSPQGAAYGVAQGGTPSVALPAMRPVFAELFVQRDEEGRITRKVMSTSLGKDVRTYAYDAAGRLVASGVIVAKGEAVATSVGDRKVPRAAGVAAAGCQPFGQGLDVSYGQAAGATEIVTEVYAYGPAGERLASTRADVGETRYVYDEAGRMVQAGAVRFVYDQSGRLARRLTPAGETRYAYDAAGNLVAVALPDGRVVEYLLDAAGRRIAKSVNGVMLEKFAWRDAVTLESTSRPDGSGLCRFIYSQDSRMPVCMESGGLRLSLAFDKSGTPFAVANANGDLIQACKHDAFGNVVSMLTQDVRIPFGFGGGLFDADTGLVHLGCREYDPRIGRFIQPDPLGYVGGDVDVYGYCLDDPVNLVDPLGLEPGSEGVTPKPQSKSAIKAGVKKGLGIAAEEVIKKGIKKGIDEVGKSSGNESVENLKALGKACLSGPTWWQPVDWVANVLPGPVGGAVGGALGVPMCGAGMMQYAWRRNKGVSREQAVKDFE